MYEITEYTFCFKLLSFSHHPCILQVNKVDETSEHLISTLKAEKEELESSLNKEKLQTLQLKQELTDAETRNRDLYKVTFATISTEFNLLNSALFQYLKHK